MSIAVRREGSGPEILLVHGGASPEATWRGLDHLCDRWTLAFAYRRGYPPSPLAAQDFQVDAADLVALLDERPHVVAHSYGSLGAVLAATERPDHVRSLTLIEPPLYGLVRDDPAVARLELLGDIALRDGLDADPRDAARVLEAGGSDRDRRRPASAGRRSRRSAGTRRPPARPA